MKRIVSWSIVSILLFVCIKEMFSSEKTVRDFLKTKRSYVDVLYNYQTISLDAIPKKKNYEIGMVCVNDTFIIMSIEESKGYVVYAWTIEGKLLGKIGDSGKGPGEYIGGSEISLTDTKVCIFDGARSLYVLYLFDKKTGKFVFEDNIKLENTVKFTCPELTLSIGDKFLCFETHGKYGTDRIKLTDKYFKPYVSFHTRKKNMYDGQFVSIAENGKGLIAVADYIRVLETSGKIIIYDIKGKEKNVIKFGGKAVLDLFFDESGEYVVFTWSKSSNFKKESMADYVCSIYNVNGKHIGDVSMYYDMRYSDMLSRSFYSGSLYNAHKGMVFIEKPKLFSGKLTAKFYTIRLK